MILALDMGNTNIVLGGIDENKIHFVSRVVTDRKKTEDEYAVIFSSILNMYSIDRKEITGAIISSVVPPLVNIIKEAVEKMIGITPLIVGPGVKTGLNIKIDNPAQLGCDLVVGAVAATHEYPAPLIIIDMGTATTVGIVDSRPAFIGGMIMPGINTSLRALQSRASLLPAVEVEAPPSLIGRNTIHCMQSGIVYGNACMTDGIIDRISRQYDCDFTVVATGGMAKVIVPYCLHPIVIDPLIQLRGLYRLSCISQGEA